MIKGTNKKSLGPVAITQLCQMMNIESVYKEQDLDFAVCSFQQFSMTSSCEREISGHLFKQQSDIYSYVIIFLLY